MFLEKTNGVIYKKCIKRRIKVIKQGINITKFYIIYAIN